MYADTKENKYCGIYMNIYILFMYNTLQRFLRSLLSKNPVRYGFA